LLAKWSIPLLRALPLAGLLALPAAALAQDADGDGVANAADAFPCDAARASVSFFPGETTSALLAFEDQWPGHTDLDFNDVAVRVHHRIERDAAGNAVRLAAVIDPVALGGDFSNGLALQLPVAAAGATFRRRVAGGPWQALALEPDASATAILSADLRELFAGAAGPVNARPGEARRAGDRLELEVTFAAAAALSAAAAPFDLFVFRAGDFSHQIHFPTFAGTAAMNAALFNSGHDASSPTRRFVHRSGVPAALNLMTSARYPLEGVGVSALFPDILDFAASGGARSQAFYAGRVAPEQGHDVPALALPAVAAPETACAAAVSETCTDFATLGFASREACLRDGAWHVLGAWTAQSPVGAADNAVIDGLVKAGADFKVHFQGTDRTMTLAERIISDCQSPNLSCLYFNRERGTGWGTTGFGVYPTVHNGNFWVGAAYTPNTFNDFFQGTPGEMHQGFAAYRLAVRPERWRVLGTFSGGQAIPQSALDELRALALRGASFKLAPGVGLTTYRLIHRVFRVIPDTSAGAGIMWFYARREHSDGGERTLGVAVGTQTQGALGLVNGDWWLGSAATPTTIDAFFGGTQSNLQSGRFASFTLFVNDELAEGNPAYSASCAQGGGWASAEACLRDGRWHRLGSFTGGAAMDADALARLNLLVEQGADFKVRRNATNGAIVDVDRLIRHVDGATDRHWFYARREYGTSWTTLGMTVGAVADNGNFWIGNPNAIAGLGGFMTGTSGHHSTGYFDFQLFARLGRWRRLLSNAGGGVPLEAAQAEEVRALARRGASFKFTATSATHRAVLKAIRVIPDGVDGRVHLYAAREHSDGGERTLGMTVSAFSDNGAYWVGSPVAYSAASGFFGGTASDVETGTLRYDLWVED
jgi:LruC domain-containing protein